MENPKITIYCMKSPTLGGVNTRKIGMTGRHVKYRLSEANSQTFGFPDWTVELAKQVDLNTAERNIHSLLEDFNLRTSPRREFFDIPLSTVKKIFDLLSGKYYTENDPLPFPSEKSDLSDKDASSEEIYNDTIQPVEDVEPVQAMEVIEAIDTEGTELQEETVAGKKGSKDMKYYIPNSTIIRHKLLSGDEWIGEYDSESNTIKRGPVNYSSPTAFANAHSLSDGRSGWTECYAKLPNNEWIPLKKLDLLDNKTNE